MVHVVAGRTRTPLVRGNARALVPVVVLAAILAATTCPGVAAAAWRPTPGQVFAEQLASQRMITELVSNRVASLYIGKSHRHGASVLHAPINVTMRDGNRVSGWLVLRRYRYRWYFHTITAGGQAGDISPAAVPEGISSAALNYCISSQATNQWFAKGVRYGYFRQLDVVGVTNNWNTATVQFVLSGGTRGRRNARMTCVSQTSSAGKQYWFMTGLR